MSCIEPYHWIWLRAEMFHVKHFGEGLGWDEEKDDIARQPDFEKAVAEFMAMKFTEVDRAYFLACLILVRGSEVSVTCDDWLDEFLDRVEELATKEDPDAESA